MKNVLLIVKRDSDSFHVDGVMTLMQKARLQQLCTSDEKSIVDFTVSKLEVRFETEGGGVVILHT